MLARPALAQSVSTDPMVQLLTHYKLVQGDSQGLRLQDPLTRAELAVLVARALGKEADAQLLQGLQVFSDVPGTHWGSGAIALVKRLGYVQGYPDGTFGPKRNVTYAEMLTIFLRLVSQEPSTGTWPANVLVRALELNLHPPGVVLGQVASSPSIRLHVFQSLGATMSTVPVTPEGKTLLQANVDSTPPQVTLAALPQVTPDRTITVSGTVADAVKVTLNGNAVPIVFNGFSVPVTLEAGANQIVVEAFDLAGNKATASATVTRAVNVARIEITGPAEVNAGASASYTVQAFDATGVNLGGVGVTARTEGNIGTFALDNSGKGTLTAGANGAAGRIVLTAGSVTKTLDVKVRGPAASAIRVRVVPPNAQNFIELDKTVSLQVEVLDAAGNRVTADSNRTVTLGYSGLAGVTVSPVSTTTRDGVAAFTIRGTVAGTVVLKPLSAGLAAQEYDLLVSSPVKVKMIASKTQLTPDGYSTAEITAQLVDTTGKAVTNSSGSDVVLRVTHTGSDGRLLDSQLVIRRNASTSNSFVTFEAGTINNRTAVIGAQITSGQPYQVEQTSIVVKELTLASARKLRVFVVTTTKPDVDDSSTLVVEVLDANDNRITEGSVAFQLEVTTSNGEAKTAGIPSGVTVYMAGHPDLVPVSDGVSESSGSDGDDIVGRTVAGLARITLSYDKSGIVAVKPILMGATSEAYDNDGDKGAATSSTGLVAESAQMWYQGTPTFIRLTVDSALGSDQIAGSVKNTTSTSFTLRARILDEQGYPIPALSAKVRVDRISGDGVTNFGSASTKTTSDGVATWTYRATTDTGVDTFQATDGGTLGLDPSDAVDVWVTDTKPDTPAILSVWGADANGDPEAENYVAADDTYMRIELAPMAGFGAAVLRVFREGSSTAIHTTAAVDLGTVSPYVLVPKSAVPKGTYRYQVTAKNAAGESSKSGSSDQVTSASLLTGTSITKAQYNAANNRLTITGRGFNSTSTGGAYDVSELTLKIGATTLNLAGATPTYTSSSSFYVTLTSAQAADLEDTSVWNGAVRLDATSGWYSKGSAGDLAPADLNNPVTPMAHVTQAYFYPYTQTTRRIYIIGKSMNCSSTSCMDTSKLTLVDVGNSKTLSLSGASVTRVSDTEWYLTLSSSQWTNFSANFDGMDTYLTSSDGWFKDGSSGNAAFEDVQLQSKLRPSGVSYDRSDNLLLITGFFFGSEGDLDVSKISIRDKSRNETRTLAPGKVTVNTVNSTTIEIEITDATLASQLDAFSGSDVSFMPGDGWFADEWGRETLGLKEGERYTTVKQ